MSLGQYPQRDTFVPSLILKVCTTILKVVVHTLMVLLCTFKGKDLGTAPVTRCRDTKILSCVTG